MKNYDHKKIEGKLQKDWEKKKIYRAKDSDKKTKFFPLVEFPYPSGAGLHTGHIRSYTAMDIISRKRRMEGFNVLYPIGWDAFGLPTENYAIKTGKKPALVTKQNTDTFRRQLKSVGFSFDWSREINTTDPKYYKWTQWIFLQFFKKGLAYKAKSFINWCPSCKIGLANEEAIGGVCERCGGQTEKREKEQWMLAITKYADRLDKDLDTVDYPERVKTQQRNWIGKSEGAEIEFKIIHTTPLNTISMNSLSFGEGWGGVGYSGEGKGEVIKVFTTRADTIFGATYMVLAPEHKLVEKFLDKISNKEEVEKYIKDAKKKTEIERVDDEKEKTGVELKGIKAINPASGEEIPVFIADYVLAEYGTGAIMAVPAHDERDRAFAKKYKIPTKNVIEPYWLDTGVNAPKKEIYTEKREITIMIVRRPADDHYLCMKWSIIDWQSLPAGGIEEEDIETAARRELLEETGYKNLKFVKKLEGSTYSEFFRPHKGSNALAHATAMVFELENEEQVEVTDEEKKKHEVIWVAKNKVSEFLNLVNHKYMWQQYLDGQSIYSGLGILVSSGKFDGMHSDEAKKEIVKFVGGKIVTKFKLRDWIFSRQRYWGEPIPLVNCEKCGLVPVSDKDLPVKLPDVKSYKPTDTGESPLASIAKWVSVKCPKCKGKAKRETDTMPNWAGSSWYYLRYTDPKNSKEFASKKNLKYWTPVDWYNGGMEHTTLHLLYSRFWHKFLYDLKLVPQAEPYAKRTSHGMILGEGGVKMSKSIGNVVNPDSIVKTYGADTLRVYEMFMGPFEDAVAWSTDSIIGSRRFIEKVWRISQKGNEDKNPSPSTLTKILHKTIKKVSEDIEDMRFNTAISAMMILATEMESSFVKGHSVNKEDLKKFMQILAPFAPHIAEYVWLNLGEKKSIHLSGWPKWNESLIKDDEVKIAIQINGKARGELMISALDSEDDVKKKTLSNEIVKKYLGTNALKKIIYVKNRVINILY